ncbi:MAG: LamG-like jellyroll fold domain-containing protein [Segetibacter sp.]
MDPLSFAGLRLGITRFGKVECQLSINQFPVLMSTEQSLPHNKWQFVVATINTASGQACLYVNGKMVKKEMIPKGAINWPVKKQYIGRNAKDEKFLNLFPINVLNGIIDEIVLWRRELDSAFVFEKFISNKNHSRNLI